MDAIKIEAAVKATDEVARALWLKPVATETVAIGDIEGEPVAPKPVEYEDAYPKGAAGIRPPIFMDAQGRPVTPWDFAARKRGTVVQAFEGVDVEPDPKSTPDKPLPPLSVKPYTKIAITGPAEARASLEAKLSAARATDVAKAALVEAEPVEAEALAGGGVIKR